MTHAAPLIRDPRNAIEPTLDPHATGGEQQMVRYFYAWIPAVVLFAAVFVMSIPYLALIVLLGVLLAVVAAVGTLVWATVSALYAFGRSVLGHTVTPASRERGDTGPQVALNPGGVGGAR
jgi:hypothetical protein